MIARIKLEFKENEYSHKTISQAQLDIDCDNVDIIAIQRIGYAIIDSAILRMEREKPPTPSEEPPLPSPDVLVN